MANLEGFSLETGLSERGLFCLGSLTSVVIVKRLDFFTFSSAVGGLIA
jgi:hypothetical protein